jgi:hypothetical protein
VYPASVWVPVVSHGLDSVMTLTSRLIAAGSAQLPPLCPGSMTTTVPASGWPVVVGGPWVGEPSGELRAEAAGDAGDDEDAGDADWAVPLPGAAPAALPVAEVLPPEQAASMPMRSPPATNAVAGAGAR